MIVHISVNIRLIMATKLKGIILEYLEKNHLQADVKLNQTNCAASCSFNLSHNGLPMLKSDVDRKNINQN